MAGSNMTAAKCQSNRTACRRSGFAAASGCKRDCEPRPVGKAGKVGTRAAAGSGKAMLLTSSLSRPIHEATPRVCRTARPSDSHAGYGHCADRVVSENLLSYMPAALPAGRHEDTRHPDRRAITPRCNSPAGRRYDAAPAGPRNPLYCRDRADHSVYVALQRTHMKKPRRLIGARSSDFGTDLIKRLVGPGGASHTGQRADPVP